MPVAIQKTDRGLVETKKKLGEMGDVTNQATSDMLWKYANIVMRLAREETEFLDAVDSASMKESIRITLPSQVDAGMPTIVMPTGETVEVEYLVTVGGPGQFHRLRGYPISQYAAIVHDGLGKGKNSIPRPFMTNAEEKARGDWERLEQEWFGKVAEAWVEGDVKI